jgi:hypothetical protein
LTYLELLLEMLARRKGNNRIRWRIILIIEAIKYVYHSRPKLHLQRISTDP